MKHILTVLEEHPDYEPLRTYWDESQTAFQTSGTAIIAPRALKESCAYLRLDGAICSAVQGLADDVRLNDEALRFLWHCHYLAFMRTDYPGRRIRSWPDHRAWLGNQGPLFNALLFLTGVPRARARHEERGIPREVSVSTLSDYELWIHEYHDLTGQWGLREIGWLHHHFRGEIFRLGRLQFLIEPFDIPVVIYRNRATRAVCALAEADRGVRYDGRYVGANSPGQKTAFTTVGSGCGDVVGNPINPDGLVEQCTVRLPAGEWDPVAERGAPALSFHIPKDGPLDFDECGESFRRAVAFYPRYFPEWAYRCFFSESWLYDVTLGQVLPPASNIVRFQREFYLAPLPNADDAQLFERVFGHKPKNLATLPRNTSLRKAVLDHADAGGSFYGAGAFIFSEDLAWGESVYRRGARGLVSAASYDHDE